VKLLRISRKFINGVPSLQNMPELSSRIFESLERAERKMQRFAFEVMSQVKLLEK
jgi:hypothetical protein